MRQCPSPQEISRALERNCGEIRLPSGQASAASFRRRSCQDGSTRYEDEWAASALLYLMLAGFCIASAVLLYIWFAPIGGVFLNAVFSLAMLGVAARCCWSAYDLRASRTSVVFGPIRGAIAIDRSNGSNSSQPKQYAASDALLYVVPITLVSPTGIPASLHAVVLSLPDDAVVIAVEKSRNQAGRRAADIHALSGARVIDSETRLLARETLF